MTEVINRADEVCTKPYIIDRAAWAAHDRRAELGLLELAARIPSLDETELAPVVEDVQERGLLAEFLSMAEEAEREERVIANALLDELPEEATAAYRRAGVWGEFRMVRASLHAAPSTKPRPGVRRSPRPTGRRGGSNIITLPVKHPQTDTAMREELMSTAQFADTVGVVPETVRRWVRDGRLGPAGRTPTGFLRFSRTQVAGALAIDAPMPTARSQGIEAHVLAARRRVEALRRSR